MPELKRIFNAGKMNRDLDDRLVPPGEYREALNINIGRSEGSDVGAVENLRGNLEKVNLDTDGNSRIPEGATCIGSLRDNTAERIYFFVTTNNTIGGRQGAPGEFIHQVWEFEQVTSSFNLLVEYNQTGETNPTEDWMNLWSGARITGVNLLENLLFWTDNRNEPRRIDIVKARANSEYYNSDFRAAVIKKAPVTAPQLLNVYVDGNSNATDSTFLSDKLPRFAYRYQFEDGEYSVLSPFTQIVFDPETQAQKDAGGLVISNNAINRATITGDIVELDNKVRTVVLRLDEPEDIDFSTDPATGRPRTTVEFLYKDTSSNTIYIIGEGEPRIVDEVMGVEYTYNSQDPFRAIPASQLTRVSDAVPRQAQSQEIAGGRIVYGNYLQNYDLPEGFDFSVSTVAGPTNASVKRRRTYQVGVILSDRFGRVSPVILSSSGRDSIFVPADTDQTSLQLRIDFSIETSPGTRTIFPEWADSYKIVVKQREQEYYNVVFSGDVGTGMTNSSFARSGDNINKLPIDQTIAVDVASPTRPSSEKVYINFDGTNQSVDPTLYTPQGINTTTGNIQIPTTSSFVDNEQVVFETEPVISNLDIFFETSTGGLVRDIPDNNQVLIDFSNCYAQAASRQGFNGSLPAVNFRMEINRIRAGFNEPAFDVGVRAHLVQENFAGEERRGNTLIHSSGLFNSRTNTNQLNQFNEAEGGLTINLDPSDGTIQKLFAEDTQLIIWQEDKVSRSPIDKDFIYSAEGGQVPVTSNTQYLGTIAPYAGEYGISRDPDSFAVYGTRKYFTDKNRGVVLRLSQDGLTEVSGAGMNDFFRDAFRTSSLMVGSFDEYHDTYVLTIIGNSYVANPDTNIATVRENVAFNDSQMQLPVDQRDSSFPRPFDYFTVSFEEDVNGWKGFASYRQESGLTLNNRYYTFSSGRLWEHNTNPVRNNFYGVQYDSLIEFIFNDSSSLIKEFKTLSTEGTPGWDCTRLVTDIERFPPEDPSHSVTSELFVIPVAADGLTNTAIPPGIQQTITDIAPTAYTFVFEADPGYEWTNENQLRLDVIPEEVSPLFTVAQYDDAGERLNPAATEQDIVGGRLISVVQFNPPPDLIFDDVELPEFFEIVVSGDGPSRVISGDQYTINLQVDPDAAPIEGFQDVAWETLRRVRGTTTVTINDDWYTGDVNDEGDEITEYVTYGIQSRRVFNSDGSLNILQDTRYFPFDEDGNPEANYVASGVQIPVGSDTLDINYPSNLIPHIQTDTGNEVRFLFGNSPMIPDTYVFSGGQPKTRNDLFISQKFNIPTDRMTYDITAEGGGNLPNLPRYHRLLLNITSEAASDGLNAGPDSTDPVEFNRSYVVQGTPFGGSDSYTGNTLNTNSVTVGDTLPFTPSGDAGDPSLGVSIDPRGTTGSITMEFINSNPRNSIPPPTTAGDLPEGWGVSFSGVPDDFWDGDPRFTYGAAPRNEITIERDFHPGALTADTTIEVGLNGRPEAHRTSLLWGTNPGRTRTAGEGNLRTLDYNYIAPVTNVAQNARNLFDHYTVGDYRLDIDLNFPTPHSGIFAARRMESLTPSGGATVLFPERDTIIDSITDGNDRFDDNYWLNFGGADPFPIGEYAIAPLGGFPRGRRYGRRENYDSSYNWYNSPNVVVPGDGTFTATVGYGTAHSTTGGTRGHAVWPTLRDGEFAQGGKEGAGFRVPTILQNNNININDILLPHNPYPYQRAGGLHWINASTEDTAHILAVSESVYSSDSGPDGENYTLAVTQPGVPTEPTPAAFNFVGANSEAMNMLSLKCHVTSRYIHPNTGDLDTLEWNEDIASGLPCYRDMPLNRLPWFEENAYLRRNYTDVVANQDGNNHSDPSTPGVIQTTMPQLWFGRSVGRGAGSPNFTNRTVTTNTNNRQNHRDGSNPNAAVPTGLGRRSDQFGLMNIFDFRLDSIAADDTQQVTRRDLPFVLQVECVLPGSTTVRETSDGSGVASIYGNGDYPDSAHVFYNAYFDRVLTNQLDYRSGNDYSPDGGVSIPAANIRPAEDNDGNINAIIVRLPQPVKAGTHANLRWISYLSSTAMTGGTRDFRNLETNSSEASIGQFQSNGERLPGGQNNWAYYELSITTPSIIASYRAHGAEGMDVRMNYRFQSTSGIKLGRFNKFWVDTNPTYQVVGAAPDWNTDELQNRLNSANPWFSGHETMGIPRYYGRFGDGSGGPRRQQVFFVPILADDTSRRPYTVPGADGMNYTQTRDRISELTNGTMCIRYTGFNGSTPDDSSFSMLASDYGDIAITQTGGSSQGGTTSPTANIYRVPHLPQLIVFVDQEAQPTTVGDMLVPESIPQLEYWTDPEAHPDLVTTGEIRVVAFDFLDSYWQTNDMGEVTGINPYPNAYALDNFDNAAGQLTPNAAYVNYKENAQTRNNPNIATYGLALDTWGILGYSPVRSLG